jgi:uncharacterized membrane protein
VTAYSDESQDRDGDAGGPASPAAQAEAEAEAKATDRFVAFSDAVIAIAITLLALALPVPKGGPRFTNGQLLHELGRDWDSYLDFFISFLVIGNHWASHRRIFRYVCRLGGHVRRLNMLWLLLMIMTPFATELLSGDGARGARFTIYALIQIIATASLMEMSREVRLGGMLRPDAPESARHPDYIAFLGIILVFAVSIPVSFFSGAAYWIWAAAPLVTRGLRLLAARRGHPADGAGRRLHHN